MTRRTGRVQGAVLAALYLVGLAHWAFFFGYGRLPLDFHDWPKEIGYFTVLRQALEQGELPLHAAPAAVTERFLANPEVPLSPQVLLLPKTDAATFVLLNTLLMYSLGFIGLLQLRRRNDLSIAGFTALFLLFNFNGSVTSHLAVGHSMWVGYFLMPFFLSLTLDLVESTPGRLWALGLGLTLLGMFLVGAFHFALWCLMFLVLLGLTRPSLGRPILRATVLALALGAFRILPAALEFAGDSRHFVGGFQSSWDIVGGLAMFKDPIAAVLTRVGPPDWWEVDYYVGLGGMAILIAWCIKRGTGGLKSAATPALARVGPALAIVTLLSLDPILRVLSKLPIPLIGAERVASRFFVVPFLFLIVIAVTELDHMLSRRIGDRSLQLAALALLGLTALDLGQHSRQWRIDLVRQALDPRPAEPLPIIQQIADPRYIAILVAGSLISLLAIGYCVWRVYARSRGAKSAGPSVVS